jgi:hypothetical protein
MEKRMLAYVGLGILVLVVIVAAFGGFSSTGNVILASNPINQTHNICSSHKCITIVGNGTNECYQDSQCTINPNNITAACIDSDGGKNYYQLGNVHGTYTSGSPYVFFDFCANSTSGVQLVEYYCTGVVASQTNLTCSYGCLSGACKSAPPKPKSKFKEVISNFFGK